MADLDLVTSSKHHTGEYFCQMHYSVTPQEFADCRAAANPALLFL